MKPSIPVGLAIMLAALALSLVPAASSTARPAQALSICDRAQFITDVTVPDGTQMTPGLAFTKTWRLKNIGTCTWTTSYALAFSSGDPLGGPSSVNLASSVAPGQTVDVSVSLTAPGTAGHYISYWKFKNASGTPFGIGSAADKAWWVEINVTGGPSPTGAAYDFAANYCSANWYSTQGNLPCAGNDGDPRGFVLNVNQPRLENGSSDPGVGLITAPPNAYNGDIHGAYPAFRVETGDHFQSILNCAYGATGCDVTFRLDYQIGGGPINTFWSVHEQYDGSISRADVDLSSLAGQDVSFILSVLASGPATDARALWANPVLTRGYDSPCSESAQVRFRDTDLARGPGLRAGHGDNCLYCRRIWMDDCLECRITRSQRAVRPAQARFCHERHFCPDLHGRPAQRQLRDHRHDGRQRCGA